MQSTTTAPFEQQLREKLAVLACQPTACEALATLRTIVNKITDCPSDLKYHRLRVANGRLQRTLLSLHGGSDALLAIGFVLQDEGGVYVWPVGSSVTVLHQAIEAIECAEASVKATTSTSAGTMDVPGAGVPAGPAADLDAANAGVADDTYPMTALQLLQHWKSSAVARKKVVGFYSDKPSAGLLRVFSNFSEHAPWQYTIPECCGRAELVRMGRPTTVALTYAEKGIMLCKASAMGDFDMFDEILRADTPASAKKLGRGVYPWDQERWERIVCTVAKTVVFSKFASDAELGRVLLSTGDQLIAEAAKNDRNWGIGLELTQPEVAIPAHWRGANMLGWALMEARTSLRSKAAAPKRE